MVMWWWFFWWCGGVRQAAEKDSLTKRVGINYCLQLLPRVVLK